MLIKSENVQDVLNDSDFDCDPVKVGTLRIHSSTFVNEYGELNYSTTYSMGVDQKYPNVLRMMKAEVKSEIDALTGKNICVGAWQFTSSFTLVTQDLYEATAWRNEVSSKLHRLMMSTVEKVMKADEVYESEWNYEVYKVD